MTSSTRLLPVFSLKPAINPTGVTFTNPPQSKAIQDTPRTLAQLVDTPAEKLMNRMVFWGSTEPETAKASLFIKEALTTFPKIKEMAAQGDETAHAELLFGVSNWAKAARHNADATIIVGGIFLSGEETLSDFLLTLHELAVNSEDSTLADDANFLICMISDIGRQPGAPKTIGWNSVHTLREMIRAAESARTVYPPQGEDDSTVQFIKGLLSHDPDVGFAVSQILSPESVLGKIAYMDADTEFTQDDMDTLISLGQTGDEFMGHNVVHALAYDATINPRAAAVLLNLGPHYGYYRIRPLLEEADIDCNLLFTIAAQKHDEAASLLYAFIMLCEFGNREVVEFSGSIDMAPSRRERYIWALDFLINTDNVAGFSEFLRIVDDMAKQGDQDAKSLMDLGPQGLIELLGLSAPSS